MMHPFGLSVGNAGPLCIDAIAATPKEKIKRPEWSVPTRSCGVDLSKVNVVGVTKGPAVVGFMTHVRAVNFAKTAENYLIALVNRFFAQPDFAPDTQVWEDAWENHKSYPSLDFTGRVRPMPFCSGKDMEWYAGRTGNPLCCVQKAVEQFCEEYGQYTTTDQRESWLASFPPARRVTLMDSVFQYDGLTAKHLRFDFFMKNELGANMRDDREPFIKPANPRLICSPNPFTHCAMGPFLRQATDWLHSCFPLSGTVTYAGGLKPNQLNEWLHGVTVGDRAFWRPGVVAVECDYSSFDCTYSRQAHDFLAKAYQEMGLEWNESQRRIVAAWDRPRGHTMHGAKVNCPVMNASGRDDTALINAELNGVVQMCTWSHILLGVPLASELSEADAAWMRENVRIVVLGDDSLTLVPRLTRSGRKWAEAEITAAVGRFGFTARDVKVHEDPRQMVFLGNRPYPSRGLDGRSPLRLYWGPTIGRRLYRQHTMLNAFPDPYAWLKGVARAAITCSAHVPIIFETNTKVLVLLAQHTETPASIMNDYNACMLAGAPLAMCSETLDLLLDVYGVTEWDYRVIQEYILQTPRLPAYVGHPAIDAILAKDV